MLPHNCSGKFPTCQALRKSIRSRPSEKSSVCNPTGQEFTLLIPGAVQIWHKESPGECSIFWNLRRSRGLRAQQGRHWIQYLLAEPRLLTPRPVLIAPTYTALLPKTWHWVSSFPFLGIPFCAERNLTQWVSTSQFSILPLLHTGIKNLLPLVDQ